jgi:hypothetical protein
MSKDEVKGLDEDNTTTTTTYKFIICYPTTFETKFNDFYEKYYKILDLPINKNEKGEFYFNTKFELDKKAIEYSVVFKTTIMGCDYDSDTYDMSENKKFDAEAFTWFIAFTKLFNTLEEHYLPPKPADPVLLTGFTRKEKGKDVYNEKEVLFYTAIGENSPLNIKLINFSNYIDCEKLQYNTAYTLASYIRRTSVLDIIKHYKEVGILAKDAKITNDGCEDCDDETIPDDH